jgi:hypothetical protein
MGWSAALAGQQPSLSGERRRRPRDLHTIGIGLGKKFFHRVGLDLHVGAVVRRHGPLGCTHQAKNLLP